MRSKRKTNPCGHQMGWRLVLALAACVLVGGYFSASTVSAAEQSEAITIVQGESTVVEAPWPVVRVAVTDPTIANVQVLSPDQVLVQGLKVGSTDVIFWSEDEKQTWRRKAVVLIDVEYYKAKLSELFPDASVEVGESREVLLVRGLLRKTDQATQLHDYLDKMQVPYVDMTSVAGVQQVQLQVRVAEASRVALRALSINTLYADDELWGGITIGPSSGTSLISSLDIGPDGTDVTWSPAVTTFVGIPSTNFEFFFKALAENQYLRILANPTLVALSGETASFLAGGEFPIPVVQGGRGGTTGATAITIEYKQFGVGLSFQPVVLGDGTIRLYTSPEVSELTDVGAVVIEGFSVPALVTRKATTTLELKSGQTFAMAGLIKNKTQAVNSRIPGLGDLPVLGPFFRSISYRQDETELIVLVTATLVEPMSVAELPPAPGFLHVAPKDWELYIDGRIEGEEPAKIDPTTADWLKKLGLDDLVGPGAWDAHDQPVLPSQAEMTEGTTTTEAEGTETSTPKVD